MTQQLQDVHPLLLPVLAPLLLGLSAIRSLPFPCPGVEVAAWLSGLLLMGCAGL